MNENILTKIKYEHEKILNHLVEIEQDTINKNLTSMYERVKEEIVQHMAGEENSVYPRLRDRTDPGYAATLAQVSDHEHHDIKESLQRLNLMKVGTKAWWREFRQFKAIVEQHCLDEEEELFNEVEKDFTRKELKEMVYDYIEASVPGPQVIFF